MATQVSDDQVAAINQQLSSDPQWQRLYQAASNEWYDPRIPGGSPAWKALQSYWTSKGLPADIVGIEMGPGGTVKKNHEARDFWKNAAISAGIMGGAAWALGPETAAAGAVGPTGAAASTSPAIPASLAAGGSGLAGLSGVLRQLAEAGIPIGTLLATRALGGGGGSSEPAPMSPELQEALSLALQRLKDQQPLQDAVNRQALAGLPAYAKGGA